jgi:hypothetical protein
MGGAELGLLGLQSKPASGSVARRLHGCPNPGADHNVTNHDDTGSAPGVLVLHR